MAFYDGLLSFEAEVAILRLTNTCAIDPTDAAAASQNHGLQRRQQQLGETKQTGPFQAVRRSEEERQVFGLFLLFL